jgi:hypothetical protein
MSSNEHLYTNLAPPLKHIFDATTKQDQAATSSFGSLLKEIVKKEGLGSNM